VGESKRKKKIRDSLFAKCPHCIYCGGAARATTIDHVPPTIMFRGKHRPQGLEFSSCRACNESTGIADLVAAMFSRSTHDMNYPGEMTKIFDAIRNNVPGLLDEMRSLSPIERSAAIRSIPVPVNGEVMKADGPLMASHLQTFAFKIGFALYYHVLRQIVPIGGGVAARWFSNIERWQMPKVDFPMQPPATLRQGKFEVSDQFAYTYQVSDSQRIVFGVSYFSASAICSFAVADKQLLNVRTRHPFRICEPGQLTALLPKRPNPR
jgi:hypothetical protein